MPWQISRRLNKYSRPYSDFEVFLESNSIVASSIGRRSNNEARIDNIRKLLSQVGQYELYLQMNFDKWLLVLGEEIFELEISEELIVDALSRQKKNKIDAQAVVSRYFTNPVLTYNHEDRKVNSLILEELLSKLPPIQFENTSFTEVAIGGEMLWSGWLDGILIIQILCVLLGNQDARVFIDKMAIFETLSVSKVKRENPVSYLHNRAFIPQLTWINKPSIKSKLSKYAFNSSEGERVLVNDGSGIQLFSGNMGYSYNNRLLSEYVYLSEFPLPRISEMDSATFSKYIHRTGYKDFNKNNYCYLKQIFVNNRVEEVRLIHPNVLNSEHYINPGDKVEKNAALVKLEADYVGDAVRVDTKRDKLRLSDGEFFKEGEDLFSKNKLLGRKENKLHFGRVDYSLLAEENIVQIRQKIIYDVSSPFSGEISAVYPKRGLAIKPNSASSFPLFLSTSESVFGKIVQNYTTDAPFVPKVLYHDDGAFPSIEDVLKYSIRVVIVPAVNDTLSIRRILGNSVWKYCDLVIIREPGIQMSAKETRLIRSLLGQFVVIQNNELIFEREKLKFKVTSASKIEEDDQEIQLSKAKFIKGNRVRFFDYKSSYPYARIESVQEGTELLLSSKDEVSSSFIGNIIPLDE
ncbi:MAG: hypothetical protein QY330_02125 [Candidatus Dojkabacteria bacterium]|uniref:Uncharacterized protein n=2 Tax=Candidatus Dojkabacteria TaxID=74243 RepID=A0A952DU00_9BACT|nr:hypothetical protein [Candidatus Dojkabacteria bacterium]WKZ28384.1 MAG: hypothetical protein QY330_02125 [Candidatus Dojkabacteria bacterium]